MNRTGKKGYTLALLALAVSYALYGDFSKAVRAEPQKGVALGTVGDSEAYLTPREFNVTTTSVTNEENRQLKVLHFASSAMQVMDVEGSKLYLKNRPLGDASTFPAKLFAVQQKNPWVESPLMPIDKRDLSCYYGVPPYRKPQKFDRDTTPITVDADTVSGDLQNRNDDLIYQGAVKVTYGDKVLNTDILHYQGKTQMLTAEGSTTLHAPEVTASTKDAVSYNLSTKLLKLKNTLMQMNGSRLRGKAEEQEIDQDEGTQHLTNGSLTTCPDEDNSWHISATEIDLDRDEQSGSAWNTVLWAGPIPFFYLPYVNFPTSNKRKTGFLYPSVSIGSLGGVALPFYLNLAPNYDWTITPSWTGKHHWQFNNQFRFMPFENVKGAMTFNYLPDDPKWDTAPSHSDRKRWFFNLSAEAWFLQRDLTIKANYSRVRAADYDYLRDITQSEAAVTDDNLKQSLIAAFNRPRYDIQLEVRKYQSLLPKRSGSRLPFAMLPQLKGNYYNTFKGIRYNLAAEMTVFNRESWHDYAHFDAQRYHFEPSFNYNLVSYRGSSLDLGGRLFLTHYQQEMLRDQQDLAFYGVDEVSHSKNRALYELEIEGRTVLERKAIDMRHTQTLEPMIKYIYVPYRNQRDIALYDTTDRVDDFYSLYSYRKFAGIDRIADTNTLTYGGITRILDSHDREVLRFGIAQAFHFTKSRTPLNTADKLNTEPRTPIAATLDFSPWEGVTLHSSASYDTGEHRFNSYNASLRYAKGGYKAAISYRFTRNGNYDIDHYQQTNNLTTTDLKQAGLELSLPLGRDWRFSGAWYRDFEQNYNIDSKFAIKYEDCCYSVALVYERYLGWSWNTQNIKQDRTIGIQFRMKGFFGMDVRGVNDPISTSTRFLPSVDEINLNR
ncbi:MAG: LPS assembly protein LptD [Succinivibrio sp.]|nr:LPS assembly protein LptD [Succinivibrio sp.]